MEKRALKSGIKNLGNNIRFQTSKISNAIDNRRLDNYCYIINRIYADYKKDKTHMSKMLRTSSPETRTRLTHQEAVANIAKILAKELGLNVALAETIASNHDIGHTFYGHDGGWMISEVEKDEGTGYLCHNAQGPRMLIYGHNIHDKIMQEIQHFHPKLSEKKLEKIRKNLWKIDDGILCHNGESSKTEFRPTIQKTENDFVQELKKCNVIEKYENGIMASTAEGCLIRPADVISYFSRDMVDGLREGLIDDLDQEYIQVLNQFGISNEEITTYLVKKDYETLSRRVENVVIKAVIDSSDKDCIRLPESVAKLVFKMRTLNNTKIVNKVTRPTEKEAFPFGIRSLRNIYKDIILDNNLLERLPTANTDLSINQELTEKYKDTPNMQFIEYICRMNPEHYQFLQEVVEDSIQYSVRQETMEAIQLLNNGTEPEENESFKLRNARILETMEYFRQNYPSGITEKAIDTHITSLIERINNGGDSKYLSKEERMGKKLGSWYLGELTDVEFVRTLTKNGLITPVQLEDLHEKFIDIDFSKDDGNSVTDAWKEITENQEKALSQEGKVEGIEIGD